MRARWALAVGTSTHAHTRRVRFVFEKHPQERSKQVKDQAGGRQVPCSCCTCGTLRIQNHWCHAHPLVPYGTRMLRRLAVCASTSAKTAGMSCRISRRSDAINSSADVCCHTFASVSREWCGGLALLPGQVDENGEIFLSLVLPPPLLSVTSGAPPCLSTIFRFWVFLAFLCAPTGCSLLFPFLFLCSVVSGTSIPHPSFVSHRGLLT